ncbi:MAG TPA: RNA methyltransferase [Polyangiales bacterium]|jgi:hypothetical protein|nr:RNA methyltransferase [Polyangiales bacterium]
MTSAVYSALVHHPVRDRDGQTVTAAVTNIDVHDIARSSHTFGLAGFFVVSPIEAQRQLVVRILEHWRSGAGQRRMPHRSEALAICLAVHAIEDAIRVITEREGKAPRVLATAARPLAGREVATFPAVSRLLSAADSGPSLILFGTGHGLADGVLASADVLIEPIAGVAGYNHLSVRAAAAIVFDRLFGGRQPAPAD